jgi:hypothetical protein
VEPVEGVVPVAARGVRGNCPRAPEGGGAKRGGQTFFCWLQPRGGAKQAKKRGRSVHPRREDLGYAYGGSDKYDICPRAPEILAPPLHGTLTFSAQGQDNLWSSLFNVTKESSWKTAGKCY